MKTYLLPSKLFSLLYDKYLSGSVFCQRVSKSKPIPEGMIRIKIAEGSKKYVENIFQQINFNLIEEKK